MTLKKPNFFIVGAAKSGTTSLWQFLKQHHEVFMPQDELYKEPCFFSRYGEAMGMDGYLQLFCHASAAHKLVGEASTAHLSDPVSAKRIFEFNPEAKIIIILRNPVKRAYSLYNWMVQDGYEYAASFEEALLLEGPRAAKTIPNWFEPQYYWNYMYISSGLYHAQVERYLTLFKKNVLVVRFEDLKTNPKHLFSEVCSFLGIERVSLPYGRFNASRRVYSPRMQFILRQLNGQLGGEHLSDRDCGHVVMQLYRECQEKLSAVARSSLKDRVIGELLIRKVIAFVRKGKLYRQPITTKEERDRVLQIGLRSGRPAPLPDALSKRLMTHYVDDIRKLSVLTGKDFSEWLREN